MAKNTSGKSSKSSSRKLSLYSNLSHKRKTKKDASARRRAEYLATLPKHPVKRLLYRLHPKRFWGYWFSKRGGIMFLKIAGIGILLMGLLIGGLFAYFRKDLDQIRPGELAKRVQSTVTKYYDRNGELLWEDTGGGNYKLAVESSEINDRMKQATIAIEDRDFFTHSGVSVSGTLRAVINNAMGGQVQGGSTLTQQLVKQVFFADEASDRGWGGVPRKIKELILSIEVERMYNKDQILTLYLNESPYGGPRNGVESGAQAYFHKSSKDLTLAEASLLAAIPQNPSRYNPYKVAGHEGLITRQHEVLNAMRDIGYITKEEAEEAKAVPILDTIYEEPSLYENIKAPHFVQMVRGQLSEELGAATVGRGGLNVTTTLDLRIQEKTEEAIRDMFNSTTPASAGFTNGAATVQDVQTGQIVAMVGSRDFMYEGFGQDNAATAYIQPGSSVKPLVYSELFEQKPSGQQNYGSGSILSDEILEGDLYNGSTLKNADGTYQGAISIRYGLARSRNIPAVKAMIINERASEGSTLQTIRDMGAESYCTVGDDRLAGPALAIGGCGVKQVDLVNAYSSLARGGAYKPQSSVLEVKNNSGETLKKWSDTAAKQIVSQQSAYIIADILTDNNASSLLGNYGAKNIPGVKTATKTGTSDKGGQAKDLWMFSYSPVLAMGVWLGNPDTSILKRGTSSLGSPIVAKVMEYAHKEVYAKDGRWKSGDWFSQPSGIQRVSENGVSQVYPSWWNKTQGQTNAKLAFDKVSKKKATDCTPSGARIELDVIKSTDPVTKKDVYSNVPDGYDSTKDDDVHPCPVSANSPQVTINYNRLGITNNYTFSGTVTAGTFGPSGISGTVTIGSDTVCNISSTGAYSCPYTMTSGAGSKTVTITITDSGYYTATASKTFTH